MSVKSSLRISKKRDPENGRITDNEYERSRSCPYSKSYLLVISLNIKIIIVSISDKWSWPPSERLSTKRPA
jgi:hypothetical protein